MQIVEHSFTHRGLPLSWIICVSLKYIRFLKRKSKSINKVLGCNFKNIWIGNAWAWFGLEASVPVSAHESRCAGGSPEQICGSVYWGGSSVLFHHWSKLRIAKTASMLAHKQRYVQRVTYDVIHRAPVQTTQLEPIHTLTQNPPLLPAPSQSYSLGYHSTVYIVEVISN